MPCTLRLAEELISRASVTPDDAGCLDIIMARLAPLGFACELIESGPDGARVKNLWAKRAATSGSSVARKRLFVFAGHTDVVPTGPLDQWSSAPFVPSHRNGRLYGRGASDMKTSLAAFVVATEEFLAKSPDTALSIGFLLTSDEEGPAVDGTVKVCEALTARGERMDYCVVGEPTSVERTGDMMVLHQGPPWTIYSGAPDSWLHKQVKMAAAEGVHIHSFGIVMPWPKPGDAPDFSATDAVLERVIDADPEALLLPRFGCDPPGWWYAAHPDEALQYDDGSREPVCVASMVWREEMLRNLRALVEHCEARYGEHMLGYHPCAQHTGEWFYPKTWDGLHCGFSPAMQRGFSAWLRKKYATEDALCAAWGDAAVLMATFLLTIFEDLTVAIATGVTLGAFLFLHRMAEAVEVEGGGLLISKDKADAVGDERTHYAAGALGGEVLVYRISGAFFFGATAAVSGVLDRIGAHPKVFVLDFSDVPLVDSTAAKTLERFVHKLDSAGTRVYFSGARPPVRRTLLTAGLRKPLVRYTPTADDAILDAREDGVTASP